MQEVPGWSPPEELFAIYHLALQTGDLAGELVEVGTWCGRSAITMGLACKMLGSGVVHAIDLFPDRDSWRPNEDGSYSFSVEIEGESKSGYMTQTVWKEPFERDIIPVYERYASPLDAVREKSIAFGVAEYIKPFRGTADAFCRTIARDLSFRLVFLDGDHGLDEILSDITALAPKLLPGGWIAFDDAFTSYEGVDQAIIEQILGSDDFERGSRLTRKLFAARRRVRRVGRN